MGIVISVSNKQGEQIPADAMSRLRGIEEILKEKQEFFEKKVEKDLEFIKNNGTKNKEVSMEALRHKKRLDAQLLQIDKLFIRAETLREVLEDRDVNREVLNTMKHGTRCFQIETNRFRTALMDSHELQKSTFRNLCQEFNDFMSNHFEHKHKHGHSLEQLEEEESELLEELEELQQHFETEQQLRLKRKTHTSDPHI